MKAIRRIVAGEDENGKAVALSDGPSPDIREDPARPGYAATRIWVTEETPAKVRGIKETLHLPHTIEPPKNGSVCRVVEFPPDRVWENSVNASDVSNFFNLMGSPGASTLSSNSAHPYMEKSESLDFCYIQEGKITLVLDKEEVELSEGDTVVLLGANHSWSNRSEKPCIIFFSKHDASSGS
jgi:mannose-6-phosphate isomerase-like protein (cupin superfamily)